MRRKHKKSRNGCKECKLRHMKCDESRPACSNCLAIQRRCSILGLHQQPQLAAYSLASASARASPLPPKGPLALPVQDLPQTPEFTLLHLELLHHFESVLSKDLNMGTEQAMQFCNMTVESALSVPYLMDQVLALSAAHKSHVHRDRQAAHNYRTQAAELQTRGLTRLNRDGVHVVHCDALPMFLYSSFLGIHSLFDALQHRDLEALLDDFVTYLAIHRGVSAVVPQSWPEIEPVLELIVEDRRIFDRISRGGGSGQGECDALKALIDSSPGLSAAEKVAGRAVIEALQWTFDLCNASAETRTKAHFLSAWATVLPVEFLDMLKGRKAEALAVLAYYAVLLHESRDFWVFADAVSMLYESTCERK
ncbi:unnamed protein product [Penicillium pancosmium]